MRVVALLFALGGCAEPPEDVAAGTPGDCAVVSINSDYLSTSVSILNSDGTLCRDDVINSGSAPPGVVTLLSGDVVVPSMPHPDGLLTLVDRYPNSVLTFVDADTGAVASQLAVGTGFASNPQDVAFLGDGRALVSRAETNRTPGTEPFDEGGDLLRITLDPPAITGRIDLGPAASPHDDGQMDPRPGRMALSNGLVWVTLGNIAPNFSRAGPGTVAAVDPQDGAVVDVLRAGTLTNCQALAPAGAGLWVGCTGSFTSGDTQLSASGLMWLDPVERRLDQLATAADLGGQPISFDLAPIDEHEVYFVGFGRREDPQPDRLLRFDRRTGQVEALPVTSPAFLLGVPLLVDGLLLVPDADPRAPLVRRYRLPDLTTQPAIDPSPTVGLPPRHLAVFR